MLMSQGCIDCLRKSFIGKTDNIDFINEVESLLANRKDASAPEIVYYYNQIYKKYYEAIDQSAYISIKRKFNQLVLSMESQIQERLNKAPDPLFESILLARIGNYIDFEAMEKVEPDTFIQLLFNYEYSDLDVETYNSFIAECSKANSFLLLADNCGEIVLDQIFVRELKKRFPHLRIVVMVRGGLVSNDATIEDAQEIGLEKDCEVITNGMAVAGTVYKFLGEKEKKFMKEADVILSKGQANYESVHGSGFHVFYSFLCKCEMFSNRFQVKPLTGMFVEEKRLPQ